MNAISSNTMGPQVLASPRSMDMNISKCDSMKYNFKRIQDFDPDPVDPVAANVVNIVEPTELAKESSIYTKPPAKYGNVETRMASDVCA